MSNQYYRTNEAAEFIRKNANIPCAPSYLRKKRVTGGGPVFRYVSRFPIYERDDLLAYIASLTSGVRSSTSGIHFDARTQQPASEDLGDLPDTPIFQDWEDFEFDQITALNNRGFELEDAMRSS
jgi:hypothetical protein